LQCGTSRRFNGRQFAYKGRYGRFASERVYVHDEPPGSRGDGSDLLWGLPGYIVGIFGSVLTSKSL